MSSPEIIEEEKNEKDPEQSQPQPTEQKTETAKYSRKNKMIIIGGALLCVAILITAVMLIVSKDSAPTSVPANNALAPKEAENKNPVLCLSFGLKSLHCEDLETGELKKYVLPDSLSSINQMYSSPDNDKYLIVSWQESGADNIEVAAVYDNKLNKKFEIKNKNVENSGTDLQDVQWLDNENILYTRFEGTYSPEVTTIYSFDAVSGKESILFETEATIEHFYVSGNDKYLYGIESWEDKAANMTLRKLVVLDLETHKVIDVSNNVLDVDKETAAVSPETGLLYINELRQEAQEFDIYTYKVNSPLTAPKLDEVDKISDASFYTPRARQVVTTEYGILAQSETDLGIRPPVKLYAATDKYRTLTLTAGGNNSIALTLNGFPSFSEAPSNKPEVSDFFSPSDDVPKKIVSYLENKVTAKPDNELMKCRSGEYVVFDIYKYDSDKQFSVYESGCGTGYMAFYGQKGETYELITTRREGMSCEDRVSLGITETTYPNCRKPGEGL